VRVLKKPLTTVVVRRGSRNSVMENHPKRPLSTLRPVLKKKLINVGGPNEYRGAERGQHRSASLRRLMHVLRVTAHGPERRPQ